jgi:nitroimidazol reductase NimA-like FMN-containing flavoprotein (pyridoxamine 5'-phosphate oxidase superfamily)
MAAQLETIPVDQCRALLGATTVGRLAIGRPGGVDIFPVNFLWSDGAVLIRTADGTKWRDGPRAEAAFEVDRFDDASETGWSVVVHGTLEEHDLGDVGPTPWAAGPKPFGLRLLPTSVTGRRIG